MRTGSLAVVALVLTCAGSRSQDVPTIPAVPEPPAAGPIILPGGTDVSQPLQAVQPVPLTPDPPPPLTGFLDITEPRPPKPGQILGRWWDSDEVLVWWPKPHPLPPLVTATRSGALPVLGRADTLTLIGGRAIDNQDIAGWRTVFGFALNSADTVGIEGRYFFLGTRTLSAFVTDLGDPRYPTFGLPFVNATTGREDVLPLAQPGVSHDLVTVYTSTRSQGAEGNFVANLVAASWIKLHAIAGYRYFQLNEGLRVEQVWQQYNSPVAPGHTTLGMIADQFGTANHFNGGQVGLHADVHRGPVYLELTGKLAMGSTSQVVSVGGETHLLTFGQGPLPLVRSYPGGVYAQLTNMGRYNRSAFALLPEGTVKVGLKSDRSRFYVGYNYLYLSDAIRPGDQLDRRVNPTQIAMLNPGGAFTGPDYPRANVVKSDFWLQGLVVGFEARY